MAGDEETLRVMYASWNDGGPRAAGEFWAEDIVFADIPDLPDSGIPPGREPAVRAWEERLATIDLKITLTLIEAVGPERFLAAVEISAEGANTGISLSETHHHALLMRDGEVAELSIFREAAGAREAAGLG